MTLSDLKKRVRVYLQDEGAVKYRDKLITETANSVLRYFWQKIKSRNPDWVIKSQALATVSGSDTITTNFPIDYGLLIRLEYTSDKLPLYKWLWPDESPITTSGKSYKYRIEKNKITFNQPSDAVYSMTLWYESVIPALSSDTDIHGLPEFFDEVIVQRTALLIGSQTINPALYKEQESSMINEMGSSIRPVVLTDEIPVGIGGTIGKTR